MSARTRGKSFERLCATAFGGQRQPNTGKPGPDVITPTLVVECKRVTMSGIRGEWIAQARIHSRKHGRPWILVRALRGSPSSVTVMDTRFALELLRGAGLIPETVEAELEETSEDG
jgi:hypothetical protein